MFGIMELMELSDNGLSIYWFVTCHRDIQFELDLTRNRSFHNSIIPTILESMMGTLRLIISLQYMYYPLLNVSM